VLRIEPPLDPLATLPDLDARLVGDVVHAVLQVVVAGMGEHVQWPAESTVDRLLHDAAHAALRERGIFVPGFEALVAARARPMLDAARELDALEATSIRRASSEVDGSFDLPEGLLGARRLRFRADRVDELEDARRGTDYKTGRPLNAAQGADTRLKHHLDAIARGDKLQAMAYAVGSGATGTGRYVFLADGVETHKRVFEVGAGNEQARSAFDDALEVLLGAFDMGVLFPRLLTSDTHQTNPRCAACEMAQACLRGDSGANRRLARFVALAPRNETAQEAALKLWSLARAKAATAPKAPREPKPKRKKRGEDAS
jgi:hypothetical protein